MSVSGLPVCLNKYIVNTSCFAESGTQLLQTGLSKRHLHSRDGYGVRSALIFAENKGLTRFATKETSMCVFVTKFGIRDSGMD